MERVLRGMERQKEREPRDETKHSQSKQMGNPSLSVYHTLQGLERG